MVKIISSSYEESRLEFFETLKKHHERMLHWWKNQKPYKKGYEHCDPMYIHSKCSYHGAAIQYCEDAIKALQENVRRREPDKVCPVNGAPCNECVPGAHCALQGIALRSDS